MSGYELTQAFLRSLAHAWGAHHSQIYPELNRLAKEGLIRVSDEGPRRRKTYAITDTGLEAVRAWMLLPPHDRSPRNEQTVRTFMLWLLDGEPARRFLLEEARSHRELHAEYSRRANDLPTQEGDTAFSNRLALEWGVRYEKAYVDWADWAAAQVVRRGKKQPWGGDARRLRATLKRASRAVSNSRTSAKKTAAPS